MNWYLVAGLVLALLALAALLIYSAGARRAAAALVPRAEALAQQLAAQHPLTADDLTRLVGLGYDEVMPAGWRAVLPRGLVVAAVVRELQAGLQAPNPAPNPAPANTNPAPVADSPGD